eukprot:jgi/Chlat1/1296/Chrsp118S01729
MAVEFCCSLILPAGFSGGHPSSLRWVVRLYSLKSHDYVHNIYAFDAMTMQNTFSVQTYPAPMVAGTQHSAPQPIALGPRWLAYAANQPLLPATGRASPQVLSGRSSSPSPSTSPASGASLVAQFAKQSSKQLASGLFSLGVDGYKTLQGYYSQLTEPTANGQPQAQANGHSGAAHPPDAECAGTVVVRDVVSRAVVAQWRAHTSALSCMAWDPTGTLLVTASVCGHNLNVFRVSPGNAEAPEECCWHLYKLYRGVTPAVIQHITFSSCSRWLAVSSARGTTHVYAINPYGGQTGAHTHVTNQAGIVSPQTLPPVTPLRLQPQQMAPLPAVRTLSVVARIRSSSLSWRQTVTAATGRSIPAGAVASVFYRGPVGTESSNVGEQVYILSPMGLLTRYALWPHAAMGSDGATDLLKLSVEPLERWDVCRHASWPEREGSLDSTGSKQSTKPHEGVWMASAELASHHPVAPLWASSNVSFMLVPSSAVTIARAAGPASRWTDIAMETLPWHKIEVRRADLVPLREKVDSLSLTHGNGVADAGAWQVQIGTNSVLSLPVQQMRPAEPKGLPPPSPQSGRRQRAHTHSNGSDGPAENYAPREDGTIPSCAMMLDDDADDRMSHTSLGSTPPSSYELSYLPRRTSPVVTSVPQASTPDASPRSPPHSSDSDRAAHLNARGQHFTQESPYDDMFEFEGSSGDGGSGEAHDKHATQASQRLHCKNEVTAHLMITNNNWTAESNELHGPTDGWEIGLALADPDNADVNKGSSDHHDEPAFTGEHSSFGWLLSK